MDGMVVGKHVVAALCVLLGSTGATAAGVPFVPERIWSKVICREEGRYIGWPTVCRRSNGELVAVFSGDRDEHVCPWGKVQMVRSQDDGETWSAPETIVNSIPDDRDAGILETKDGTLVLKWFTSTAWMDKEWTDRLVRRKEFDLLNCYRRHYEKLPKGLLKAELGSFSSTSSDDGKTWTPRVRTLGSAPHGGIQLKDGRLMLIGRHWNGKAVELTVETSVDGAKSWQLLSTIGVPAGEDIAKFCEPFLTECANGDLLAVFRHTVAPNEIYAVVVTNEGATASENLDDVRLRATFEESGTGLRLVRNVRLTVCALSVTGIKFNHDVYGCETDAAGLRRDGTPDGAFRLDDGEWCGRGATNYPACYVGGARPQVWARFAVKPVDVGSVRLGAEAAAAGFPLGGIPTHAVSFSGGDSDWVVLPACDGTNEVPRRVDVAESNWRWHVDGVGDCPLDAPFAFAETGPHRIYTTLAPPQHPWRRTSSDPQCAWEIALDRACSWAKGATTTNEMLAAVTSNIFYNCGLKYDIKEGKSACLTKSASFGLTTYLSGCSGNTVNCFDQAYAVYLFGNLLGADVYVKRLEPFGYLKRTCLVGRGYSNNPFYGDSATYESQPCCDANAVRRSSFSKHFFAMSGDLVFDGCAGPVLGTVGLDAYIQMSVDSSRSPVGSRPGTVADVFDYTDVRRFK